MELVIKIPEKTYNHIMSMQFCIPGLRNGKSLLEEILKAIRTGTPLPKGHGRLGDLDALREEVYSWGMNDYEPLDFVDAVDEAPTIIEEDKEQE